jgi:uncharacterized membrane protein
MRTIIGEHFDIIIVGGIAVMLITAYVLLLAIFKVDNAPIMTLMVSTVGGAIGLATGRKRSEANVSTERGDVVVKQNQPE